MSFSEFYRYDPLLDLEVVRLMATTGKGSYHTEVPVDGPVRLRLRRKAFEEKVAALIDEGQPPCEVKLDS